MNWKKVKLGEYCRIEKGVTGIQKAVPGEYPLVVTSDERKWHNEFQFEAEAVIIPLVSSTGHGHKSLKRIHFQKGKFAVGTILCAVIPNDTSQLNAEYLYHYLSLNKEEELVNRMRGMANVTLPMKEIAQIEIPLPTLEKQAEFVERHTRLEKSQTVLATELSHQLSLLKKLRQSFLQEAVQGLLLPQLAGEESAELLLQQIRAAKEKLVAEKKLKKGKPLPPVSEDEMPFDLPAGWVWCRLGEVSMTSEGGKSIKGNPYPATSGEWGVIKTSAVTSGEFVEQENKSFSNKANNYKAYLVQQGDVLYCRASGSKGLTGVSCVVRATPKAQLILSDKTIRYQFPLSINTEFICKYNNGETARSYFDSLSTGKSTSMNNITREQFDNLPIPLPPLAEQQRIVEKLESVLALCDALKASVLKSRETAKQLLQTALREALSPPAEVEVRGQAALF